MIFCFSQNINNNQNGYGDYHDYQNDTQNEFAGYPDRMYVLPPVSLTDSSIIDQNRQLQIPKWVLKYLVY